MKFRSTFAMLSVLAALVGAYFLTQRYTQRAETRKVAAKRVFNFEVSEIDTLEITRIGEEASRARRGPAGGWAMLKPNTTIVANNEVWTRVAEALARLQNERDIPVTAGEIAQYGLDGPALTVKAKVRGGEEVEISFGYTEPAQMYRYARLNGDAVLLVSTDAYFELDRPLNLLRNFFLVDDRSAALLEFEYARIWTGRDDTPMKDPPEPGEESIAVRLARDSVEAPWYLVAPIEAVADQKKVNELVAEIQGGTGRAHIDDPEDLSDYGLVPPRFRISFVDEHGGAQQTLYFGEMDPAESGGGLFAKRDDRQAVFTTDSHLLALLPKSPNALRERRLFTRRGKRIKQLAYEARAGSFVIAADPEKGWRMTQPARDDADQFTVSGYIAALRSLTVHRFLPGAASDYGLDDPEAVVSLTQGEDGEVCTVRFAPYEADAEYYAVEQDAGGVGLVYASALKNILVARQYFSSKELFRFSKQDAVQLDLEFEGKNYSLVKVHETWLSMIGRRPQKLKNQSDADALMDAINPLLAVAVETEAALESLPSLAEYGLDEPIFSMTVVLETQAVPKRRITLGPLVVGGAAADDAQQRFAAAPARNGIFRVKQDIIEAVREALVEIEADTLPQNRTQAVSR